MERELIELEECGWRALATEGDAARKFYAALLREDAVMFFPGGLRIGGRDRILESLGTQPWKSFQIEAPHVVSLTSDAAVLAYSVAAQREVGAPYRALVTSTYVRAEGAWRLVVHQQTLA